MERVIVYHHNDADGLTGRYLASLVNKDYHLQEYNYEDELKDNKDYDTLIFIDVSPPL